MKLLFLTSNNLATNPRLYKELCFALELGYSCSLIQFKLGNWSDLRSEELINRLSRYPSGEDLKATSCNQLHDSSVTQIINLNATSKNKLSWLKWGILEKLASKFFPLFKTNLLINTLAHSRRSLQIVQAAKQLKKKPTLICAHNLAALYPAWKLSKKWNIPFIFDVEDYHPGEFIRFDAKNEKQRREFLMKKLLPKAYTLTSASPLIGEYSLNLIGGHPNHTVILNSFPESEFKETNNLSTYPPIAIGANDLSTSGALRLVWFSQKISFGRGLEQLFEALLLLVNNSDNQFINYSNNQIIITLIGDLDPTFNQQIIQPFLSSIASAKEDISKIINLHIKNPLSQPDLHAELANHDIGLALEFNNSDLNRQLCLTNKIIAYAQAGLYILATDTPAQKQFMEEHTENGMICGQNSNDIANSIKDLLDRRLLIKDSKQIRYSKDKDLSWEHEKGKLIKIWNQILK